MGFKSWADYQLSHGRMAKDAQTVLDFLNGLKDKLAERNREDLAQLLQFKKILDSSAAQVMAWDIDYLSYQLKRRDYPLDDEAIREYFPLNRSSRRCSKCTHRFWV
jgi:Zn-dependent oligopeptidase